LGESEPDPRTQHYVFGHVVLRQMAFDKPLGVLGILHSPEGPKFLTSLWDDVADQVRANGEPADVDGSALEFRPVLVGGFPCALVRMPPPTAAPECHYVAIVVHLNLESEEPPPEEPMVSYYTLERGQTVEGAEVTMLCGWNAAGTHLNYGEGPPPDPDAFVRALTELVAKGGGDVHAAFNPGNGSQDS
jgi:hypothetical protein